jgi:CheY-like chemotaxis protein
MLINLFSMMGLSFKDGVLGMSPLWFMLSAVSVVSFMLIAAFSKEMYEDYGLNQLALPDLQLPPVHKMALSEVSHASQVQHIVEVEIPEMLKMMPYDCWHRRSCQLEGGRWMFEFEAKSVAGRFFAKASGDSPSEAFAIARKMLQRQIREWHRTRFASAPVVPMIDAAPVQVLIVDDDIDMALAMQEALNQLGCETEIATRHEDLHRKIIFSDADYILLDWNLNDKVTADRVVAKAVRLIETFSDLRQKFTAHKPRIVTHSVLDREHVALPQSGHDYFEHLDHWQKPVPFTEIIERASGLLAMH